MSDATCSGSFIRNDGGLRVNLPVEDVNWFEFLWFSRATTSPDGGWNSKSHWWERGAQCLTAPALKQWTINSFTERRILLPSPRIIDFRLNRPVSLNRADLKQRLLDRQVPIEDASENELSFALFEGGFGILKPLQNISLLGYEVPLTDDAEGQLKVDLLGISESSGTIEIIEIKNAKNTSDSPLMALTEAICYALQVIRCEKSLLKHTVLRQTPNAFRQVHLTLLAPDRYWNYWTSETTTWDAISAQFQKIMEWVNSGILEIHPNSRLTLTMRKLKTSGSA